ncbi:MAG: cell cycle transcriptional regulator TrcR [Alphaproteobacteria bacterium]
MPKATAVWLVENTTLTFKQIAEYCGLHELEVQAIADGEVVGGMQGLDPVANGQLAKEEIAKGQADPAYELQLAIPSIHLPEARTKGARYTPVAKRSDRPDAIAWLLKNHPELTDAQITKLVGTTKHTIQAVRDRSHWNTPNIRAQSPVLLGLATNDELEKAVHRARDRLRKAAGESAVPAAGESQPAAAAAEGEKAAP